MQEHDIYVFRQSVNIVRAEGDLRTSGGRSMATFTDRASAHPSSNFSIASELAA